MGRIVGLGSQGGIMLSIGSTGSNSGRLFPWGEPCVVKLFMAISSPMSPGVGITVIFPPTLSTAGFESGGARITELDTF